jgi:hypothetical protein
MQELMGAEAAEGSTSGSPPTGSTGSAMQRLGLGTLQEHAVRGVAAAAADGSRGGTEAAAEDSFQFQRSAMEGRSSRYSGEMIMGFDTLNSHRLEEADDDDETSDDSDDGEDVEADRWQANLESRLFGHFVMPESEHG